MINEEYDVEGYNQINDERENNFIHQLKVLI